MRTVSRRARAGVVIAGLGFAFLVSICHAQYLNMCNSFVSAGCTESGCQMGSCPNFCTDWGDDPGIYCTTGSIDLIMCSPGYTPDCSGTEIHSCTIGTWNQINIMGQCFDGACAVFRYTSGC